MFKADTQVLWVNISKPQVIKVNNNKLCCVLKLCHHAPL